MADQQSRIPNVPVVSLSDLPPAPAGKRGWPWTESSPAIPAAAPNGKPWPAIGIVTPSYQQGRFLEATLRSVLLQGYPNLVHVVEDGGSKDESPEVIARYAKFLSHAVVEKDRGQSHAINKGMARLTSAQWVTWLNSDDILLPGAIAAIGAWAVQAPADAVAVVGNGYHVSAGKDKRVLSERRDDLDGINVRNWRRSSFLQPACFFSKARFDEIGGVNESRHYAMDFELWVRLGAIGRFELIEAFIAQDLFHPDAKTQLAMGKCYGEIVQVLHELGHHAEAREMVADMYNEIAYLGGITGRVTNNWFYRSVLQKAARRMLNAPSHMRAKDAK